MNTKEISDHVQFKTILFLALAVLLVAHATMGEYGRNLLLSAMVIIVITLFLTYLHIIIFKRNIFFILIILYILLHFPIFLHGGGGLFNLVAAALLPFIILFKTKDWTCQDKTTWFLLLALFVINGLGYILGELETRYIINGFGAFIGIITIFFIAQGILLTNKRIKIFILSSAVLGIINLFVTMNTYFELISIQSPLFVSFYERASYQVYAHTGTINTVELLGEWGMLNAFLFLPFLTLKQGRALFNRREMIIVYVGFLTFIICAFISFSSAVFMLTLGGMFLYAVYSIISLYKPRVMIRFFLIALLIVIFMPIIASFFELGYIIDRYQRIPEFLRILLTNPLTAEGTSREAVYQLGLARISEKAWIFGNGFSIPEGNTFSWFGSYQIQLYVDYHNLFYCLIPIWGFTGLAMFIWLLLRSIFNLFVNIKKLKHLESPLVPLMIGLLFVLTFFLIDEYKVNATRNSYFTIVMIWLGLAVNVNSIAKRLISVQKL
ncbi:MAG TPA: hypothetical protein PKW17_12560 [Smithellaceae bacterium]|nr:hypothetical protein [Smithellaceae bacterium]